MKGMWVSFVKIIQLRFIHFIVVNFTLIKENRTVRNNKHVGEWRVGRSIDDSRMAKCY